MERISYDYIKAIALKNELEKHVPEGKKEINCFTKKEYS